MPSFFVPTPGDLTAQETPPPGICHSRPKKWLMPGGQPGGAWVQLETSLLPVGRVGENPWNEVDARGEGPLACLPRARPFSFSPTTSKRLLRRHGSTGRFTPTKIPPTPGKRVRLPRSTLHNFSRIPPISIASELLPA